MKQKIKISFYWSDISGYMASCWKALNDMDNVDLKIYAFGNNHQTAFSLELTTGLDISWVSRSPDFKQLSTEATHRKPNVIVLCGWFVPAYRKLASYTPLSDSKFILAMDTPWWGTTKQMIGRFLLKGFVKKMSAVITSGERSYQYAQRLGAQIIAKIQYGVNVDLLAKSLEERKKNAWPKNFVFIGRYSHEKGIKDLVEAYKDYHKKSLSPWGLITCGKGELENLVSDPNIDNKGFVQPNEMHNIWKQAGCLVLSSTFDPWPLIVVEACAAGLPVICTHASGSQVEVVKNYWNGLVIPSSNKESLINAMNWIEQNYEELPAMGDRSLKQAEPYSSSQWSNKIIQLVESIT